jgi:hypothetical protein
LNRKVSGRSNPADAAEIPRRGEEAAPSAADALKDAHHALFEGVRVAKRPRQFADEVADIFRRFVGLACVDPWEASQMLREGEPKEALPPPQPLEQPVDQHAAEALRKAHGDLVAWSDTANASWQFANEVADVLRRYVGFAALQPVAEAPVVEEPVVGELVVERWWRSW